MAVVGIPGHGGLQAVGELDARGVAHRTEQGVIEAVAAIVALAVGDGYHHLPGGAAGRQNGGGEFAVGQLGAAVDVVDPAGGAFFQDELDAPAVVIDMEGW